MFEPPPTVAVYGFHLGPVARYEFRRDVAMRDDNPRKMKEQLRQLEVHDVEVRSLQDQLQKKQGEIRDGA